MRDSSTFISTFSAVGLAFLMKMWWDRRKKKNIDKEHHITTLRTLSHEVWYNLENLRREHKKLQGKAYPISVRTYVSYAMDVAVSTGYLHLLNRETTERLIALYGQMQLSEMWLRNWYSFLASPVRFEKEFKETKEMTEETASVSQKGVYEWLAPAFEMLSCELEKMGEERYVPPTDMIPPVSIIKDTPRS